MKNAKKIIAIAIIGIITVASSGCSIVQKTQAGIDNTVLAKVNDDKITTKQLETRMENEYGVNYASSESSASTTEDQLKQEKQSVLQQMEVEDLLLQKAKELKLVPTDKEINAEVTKQYNSLRSQDQYKSDSDFKAALAQYGYTEASLKAQMKTSVILSKVTDYMTKDVKVTDKEIQNYYNANPLKFTEQTNTIHLAHILVKTEGEADAIEAQLSKGADFATLAKKSSTDTTSGAAGGDLGTYDQANDDTSNQLDATFMKAALALKAGQISKPVHTQFGWHVIKCIDRKDYPEKSLDSVKSQIQSTLLTQDKQTAYNNMLSKWKKAADITEYTDRIS